LHAGLLAALAASAFASVPAAAQDFYAGKTIEFIVGHYPGGGYDIYARAVARHWARNIPGNPTIVVKNMPGAGGAKAGQFISNSAPQDGTAIGAVTPGAVMSALLDGSVQTGFDPAKVMFIGTANNGTRVCVVHKDTAAKTFNDALTNKVVIGSAAVNDATHDYAFMVKNVAGANLSIVTGYKGTSEIGLAMERREVDGSCGWDWASFRSQRAHWIKDRLINVLVQMGLEQNDELTKLGAQPIWKYLKSDEDRTAVELIVSQQVFHRPYIAPPGVPAAQLAILRKSFMATMNDPQFQADAEKTRIDVEPLAGDKIQELVTKLARTPPAVIARAKRAIRP
jgi:tripartite-type tricarboxylate transporter receptor subunit TctC